MFCFPPHPLTRLRLVEGVIWRQDGARTVLRVGAETELTLDDRPAAALLAAVAEGTAADGPADLWALAEARLVSAGVLCVEFLSAPGGAVVARLQSMGWGQPLRVGEPAAGWQVHRHSTLRPDESGWRLSQPLSRYELQLASAGLLDRLHDEAGTSDHELCLLLRRALWAGALIDVPRGDEAALGWSREDLLFHTASRRRADHKPRGKRQIRPAWAPPLPAVVPSTQASAELRQRLAAVPFESVLAGRRSVRGQFPALTVDELRDLLCIVQAERGQRPTAPCRSYPMAGGLQALDFYLVAGTPTVLFRFDAAAGALVPVAAPQGSVQRLLDEATQGWGTDHGTPRALVIMTARLPELAARYEAIAYRLALLEAGCAAQVLAQVATALGIGSCFLGSGDSELFALATGLPEWQQPAIAEIAIAGRLPLTL